MGLFQDLCTDNANCSNRKVAFEIPATRAKKCDFGEVPTDKFEDISKDFAWRKFKGNTQRHKWRRTWMRSARRPVRWLRHPMRWKKWVRFLAVVALQALQISRAWTSRKIFRTQLRGHRRRATVLGEVWCLILRNQKTNLLGAGIKDRISRASHSWM